jgi:hypothetical protein
MAGFAPKLGRLGQKAQRAALTFARESGIQRTAVLAAVSVFRRMRRFVPQWCANAVDAPRESA